MKPLLRHATILLAIAAASACTAVAKDKYARVQFPAGVQHDAWDGLLKKYVNEKGLVDYAKWKSSAADRKTLDDYLAQFAAKGPAAKGDDLAASGLNAYNAFAIRWILENYPTESIQALPKSFKRKAHPVGGTKVALEDIEHGTMRPLLGYRAHAALVCCARSCPPLQRTAYTAGGLNSQIATAYRTWLGRPDLNKYMPDDSKVEISSIFKWFKEDFDAAGGVPKILGQYGPSPLRGFLGKGGYKIDYMTYRWGLNDKGSLGEDYSRANLLLDSIF